MFRHVMRSTKPTAAHKRRIEVRAVPINASVTGSTRIWALGLASG